jgi:ribose transport system substrate-binding protein
MFVALVLGATACTSSQAASSRPNVVFLSANTQLNFSLEMAAGYRFGVDSVGGVDEQVAGPDIVDGPKQAQIFQQLIKTNKDGISVFSLTQDLLVDDYHQASKDGIPIVAVDNPPSADSKVRTFVGNDNRLLGRMLADQVIAKLPAGATGTIVLGTSSPGALVLDRRADGIRAELQKKLPGVTVLGPFDTKQDVANNLDAWNVLVSANPSALAFLGTGDADGWNLAAIRQRTHGTWLAGAFDLDPRAMQAVKSGDLLLVSPEHYIKGAVAGYLQAEQAKNGARLPTGWVFTPGLDVTPANIDAIMAREASPAAKDAWFAPEVDQILHHISASLRPLNQAG